MQIGVTFRHMEADPGAKNYVEKKVKRLQKYIVNPQEVHVVLSQEKFRHIAEMTIIGTGVTLNSQGENNDLYTAIDQMVEKAERQIRDRRGRGRRKRTISSSSKTLDHPEKSIYESGEEKTFSSITQRKHLVAKPMSLEEALAQMALSKEDFLFFINSDTEQMNILHRKKDGGYEWVEPSPE